MIYQAVIAASLVLVASGKLYTEDPAAQKELWSKFKTQHKKRYTDHAEESARFNIFLDNLKSADSRNDAEKANGGNEVHGVTKFSDLTQAEFQARFLTADRKLGALDRKTLETADVALATTDTFVDWTGIYTTPVKDQGYCGSCWAFSATEQIESDSMRTLSASWVLSPEQFVQCTTACYGCNGGWTEKAFNYAMTHSIEQNSDYPYTSYNGITGAICSYNSAKGVVKVSSWTTISGETAMANYVQQTGPLSICLDASSWNTYTGGIMTVCGNSVDHCVQAVGVYPVAAPDGYWKVRNSWGTSWGESGYIQLAYGQNTCDITNDPIYTAVVKV